MSSLRTYSELLLYNTFEDRFNYLNLFGKVGEHFTGDDRYIKQQFYQSEEWRQFRHAIIVRDEGCDLAILDREIYGKVIIHHLVPITIYDVINKTDRLMDPNNVVCTSYNTHQMIHYGTIEGTAQDYKPRTKNDTIPWK